MIYSECIRCHEAFGVQRIPGRYYGKHTCERCDTINFVDLINVPHETFGMFDERAKGFNLEPEGEL